MMEHVAYTKIVMNLIMMKVIVMNRVMMVVMENVVKDMLMIVPEMVIVV